jgi:hypothetical protein
MKTNTLHYLLIVPVAALILAPLLPFVNGPGSLFGVPVILFWVGGWAVATAAFLYVLYSKEIELDDEDSPIIESQTEERNS